MTNMYHEETWVSKSWLFTEGMLNPFGKYFKTTLSTTDNKVGKREDCLVIQQKPVLDYHANDATYVVTEQRQYNQCELYSIGRNGKGQLGNGTNNDIKTITKIKTFKKKK
eukprot:184843_1